MRRGQNVCAAIVIMVGEFMNNIDEYIEQLTGKLDFPFSKLKSAQKARVIAWARSKNIDIDSSLTLRAASEEAIDDSSRGYGPTGSTNLGIGIDIQNITGLFPENIKDLKSDEGLLEIFTMAEISYCESKDHPLNHLTGIFSLKEAIMKASEKMLPSIKDIEILHNSDGAPYLDGFNLSVSYADTFAVAVAVGSVRDTPVTRQSVVQEVENLDQPTKNLNTKLMARKPINQKTHVLVTIITSIVFAVATTLTVLMIG